MKRMWLETKEQTEWAQFEMKKREAWEKWEKQCGIGGEKERQLRERQEVKRHSLKLGISKRTIKRIRQARQQ